MARIASVLAPLLITLSVVLSLIGLHRAEQLDARVATEHEQSLADQRRFVGGDATAIDDQLGDLDRIRGLAGAATRWRYASVFLLMASSVLGLALVVAHTIQVQPDADSGELALTPAPTFLPKG